MKRMVTALTVVVTLGLLGSPVGAEDKPGPEKAYLDALVGEWDATVKFMGGESKATQSSRKMSDMWVTADFRGEFGGAKFTGHSVTGYDTRAKKFTGIWVDSMSTSLMHLEGSLDKSGKVLTETGETYDMSGAKVKHKMVTKVVDKDTIEFEMFEGASADKPTMTITYKRKK